MQRKSWIKHRFEPLERGDKMGRTRDLRAVKGIECQASKEGG
jgi:hypothetical protein